MPKIFSGKEIATILSNKYGFEKVGIKGSHLKIKKIVNSKKIVVIIPLHLEVKIGTFYNILRQARIEFRDFLSI